MPKADTPVNSTMSIAQARKLVEQLKIEASMYRIKVRKPSQNSHVTTPLRNHLHPGIEGANVLVLLVQGRPFGPHCLCWFFVGAPAI
eukprot:g21924.t1